MKVRNRRIDKGETFCSSLKTLKNIFGDIFDDDCFVYMGDKNKTYNSKYYGDHGASKAIKGMVVARFSVINNDHFPLPSPHPRSRCCLTLFAVRQDVLSQSLCDKFVSDVLPLFAEQYKKSLISCDNPVYQDTVLVELYNDTFITYSLQRFA